MLKANTTIVRSKVARCMKRIKTANIQNIAGEMQNTFENRSQLSLCHLWERFLNINKSIFTN